MKHNDDELLDVMLERIDAEIFACRTKVDTQRTRLDKLTTTLDALVVARNALAKAKPGQTRPAAKKSRYILPSTDKLCSLTLEEAAIEIAERNGGVFYSRAARPALVDASLLSAEPKRSSAALCHHLRRSKRFERAKTNGYYDLQPAPEPASSLTTDNMKLLERLREASHTTH